MSDVPVLVRWRDAYSVPDNWLHEHDVLPDPVIVSSVGYIVPGHDGYLVLADSRFDSADGRWYGGVQCIPVGMVVQTVELEEGLR